jgi:ABC-2 type transport system ATP-binding protein
MQDPIIDVKDFQKSYGEFAAVKGINFSVNRGEIFGLLGPNGAGKTTTLESLEGLRKPDSGEMRVAGLDPSRQPGQLHNTIGVQLQTSALPETITPSNAMKLFCGYHSTAPRMDLLTRLGLDEKKNTQYHELSTGQKRRLSLALAIAHNPPVLILDEPTAGLDVGSRVELHEMMRKLKESGTTIILATHDMAEAEELSDRVAILLQGEIVRVGTPMEITASGSGLTKVSIQTQDGSFADPDLSLPGVSQRTQKENYAIFYSTDIGGTLAAMIAQIENRQDTLIDLRVERPTLEDRFLEITHKGGKS